MILAHPLVATAGPIGVLVIAREAGDSFTDEEGRLARTMGDALAAVIEIDRLHRQETQQALAEERQALARDLHDAVTQSIYSATLIAEALPAVYERDPDEGLRNLERLRRLVRAALAEMRTLLFELRPAALQAAPLDVLVERLGDALSGQTDISVDMSVDEDLDLPPDVKVVFYRVMQEALSNITKHARASAVSARVEAAGDAVTLTVVDDGRGFDPAAVPEGPMGMHIMAERLSGIGAEFSVLSAPGEGHHGDGGLAPHCFGPAPTGENGSVTADRDIRVMIVDDHQMVREGLKVLLSTCGDIRVVGEAADGLDAVEECRRLEPDVVLMDVMMPVMDGAAATAAITAACPGTRVIALTSFVDPEYVQLALDAGAISYLLKDARPEVLTQAIHDAVEGRGTIDSSAMKALFERRQDEAVGEDLTEPRA